MKVTDLMPSKVIDIQDNLVLKSDGSVSAVYEIPSIVVNTMDDKAREGAKDTAYSFFSELSGYGNYVIDDFPEDVNLTGIFQELLEMIDPNPAYYNLAYSYLNKTLDRIYSTIGMPYKRKWYVAVPLKSVFVTPDLIQTAKEAVGSVKKGVMRFLDIGEPFLENWHEAYKTQNETLERQMSILKPVKLTREEMIIYNIIQYMPGQSMDANEKEREFNLVDNNISNLDDKNIVVKKVSNLKFVNGDKESYCAMFPIQSLPVNYSYFHLLEELAKLPFPVRSKISVKVAPEKGIGNIDSKAKMAENRAKATSQEATEAGGDEKGSTFINRYLLKHLRQKIDQKEKVIYYLHTLYVYGDSLEEIKDKYNQLFILTKSLGVRLARANADQIYLFYKNVLGEYLSGSEKNWVQKVDLKGFVENMFFVSKEVGDPHGFYIGRVDNQIGSWSGEYLKALNSSSNLVLSYLLDSNKVGVKGKITQNPHIGVFGDTGEGKSFLLKLLFVLMSWVKNTKVMYVDPKDEIKPQFLEVRAWLVEQDICSDIVDYIDSINFVSLDVRDSENAGKLDPVVFLDETEGKALATTMIETLETLGRSDKNALEDAFSEVYKRKRSGEKVGMLHVFEYLTYSDDEETQQLGKLLTKKSKASILSLCFSDGSARAIDTKDKITVLGITGLDLPKTNVKTDLEDIQKNSLVVFYAIGYFIQKFGRENKDEHSLLVMDEAWLFNTTEKGRGILDGIKRLGRSESFFLLMGSQSVRDAQLEGNETGFGTVFAFKEETNVDGILDYIKIPKNKVSRQAIKNQTMAQCMMYDTRGRKERITVDGLVYPEMSKLFDTVKTEKREVV